MIVTFIRRLLGIEDALHELRLINMKLGKLEKCVRPGIKHRPGQPHIVTGSWND